MKKLVATALLLAACAAEEIPSNVEGNLGGRSLVLGGGGWAYETPRISAGDGGQFTPYAFHLELTGAQFDPVVSIESLAYEDRHAIAQAVGLADRLSFKLSLPDIDGALRGRGSVYDVTDGDGSIRLELGSNRGPKEPASTDDVRPISLATDIAWVLTVNDLELPETGIGRVAGNLELTVTRNITDSEDSLIGRVTISFDVPLLGNWLGQCQASLLLRPEGQGCPR